MTVGVGIVEDHDLFRTVLRTIVETAPDLHLAFEASDGAGALQQLDGHEAGLLLVDLSLPDSNGIDLVAEIVRRRPQLPCVIVSGHKSDTYARRAFRAGARGYVLKGSTAELREGIDAALAGQTYLSRSLSVT